MPAHRTLKYSVLFAALIAAPLLTACGEEEGTAEQLGESIDKTMEKAGDTAAEAGNQMEDAAKELEQKVE